MKDIQFVLSFLLACVLVGVFMRFGWLFFDACIELFADILNRRKRKEKGNTRHDQ